MDQEQEEIMLPNTAAARNDVRQIVAILFTDVQGYSKKMHSDEQKTLSALWKHNEIIRESIRHFGGTEIKTIGDAFLVTFPSAVHAVECASRFQRTFRTRNASAAPEERISVRVGIHLADVVVKENDIFGDGVNIAARIMSNAKPGTISVSDRVYAEFRNRPEYRFLDLGYPPLKNIRTPMRVFRVVLSVEFDLPDWKERYIALAVQRIPARRRWAIIASLILTFSYGFYRYLVAPVAPVSIAILPFEMPHDSLVISFSDGLTEDLIRTLSRRSDLDVIAPNSAFIIRSASMEPSMIGTALQVRYLLEGTFRVEHSQTHCDMTMTDVARNTVVWSRRYTVSSENVLVFKDQLIGDILQQVKRQPELRRATQVPAAYEAYLKGLTELRSGRKEAVLSAVEHFSQASTLDPSFVESYIGSAVASMEMYRHRWNPSGLWLERGEEQARKAVQKDSTRAESYGVLGGILLQRGERETGLHVLQRAQHLNRNELYSLTFLGSEYIFNRGDAATGLQYLIRAASLDPMNAAVNVNVGIGYGMTRDFPEAVQYFRKGLTLDPEDDGTWRDLGVLYEKVGELDSAALAYQTAVRMNPGNTEATGSLASLWICTKEYLRSDSLLTAALRYHPDEIHFHYLAGVSAALQRQTMKAREHWEHGLAIIAKQQRNKDAALAMEECRFRARLGERSAVGTILSDVRPYAVSSSDLAIATAEVYSILGATDSTLQWLSRAKGMANDIDPAYLSTSVDLFQHMNDPTYLDRIRY